MLLPSDLRILVTEVFKISLWSCFPCLFVLSAVIVCVGEVRGRQEGIVYRNEADSEARKMSSVCPFALF